MAAERARLNALAAAYDSAIKGSELTEVRARQLIERITVLRHSLFTKNLMERLPSPLTPGAWRDAASGISVARLKLADDAQQWWQLARPREGELAALLGAALGIILVLKLALWRTTHRRLLRAEPPLPTFFERAVSAFWVAALRVLPVLVAAIVLYIGLDGLDLTDGSRLGELLPAVLRGVLVFTAIS